MKLTAVGIVIGIGGAIALTRWMQSLLFNEHDRSDHVRFDFSAAVVGGVLCVLHPARRAAKVDPLVALRYE